MGSVRVVRALSEASEAELVLGITTEFRCFLEGRHNKRSCRSLPMLSMEWLWKGWGNIRQPGARSGGALFVASASAASGLVYALIPAKSE